MQNQTMEAAATPTAVVKEKKKSNRSGEIELLRFIASLVIVFFHLNKHVFGRVTFAPGSNWGFFHESIMAVEFFFVCSGFLMAHSAAKEYRVEPTPNDKSWGKSVSSFMYRKIMVFLPYHLIAFALAFLTVTLINWKGFFWAIRSAMASFPSLFLIQMSGWKMYNPMFVEWYLSVMVLGMLILYPIIRKYYHIFTRVIAPVLGIFLLGYIFHKYHLLGNIKTWDGVFFKAMLRGVAGLCLGAFTFEVVQVLKKKINVNKIKGLNTVIYIVGVLGFLVVSCYTCNRDSQFLGVPLFMVVIGVCFLGGTYLGKVLNNKFVMFLGRISLPIYLAQVVGVRIAESKLLPKSMGEMLRFAIGLGITIVVALIVMWAGDALKRWYDRKVEKMKE